MQVAIIASTAGRTRVEINRDYASLEEFLEFYSEFYDMFRDDYVQLTVGHNWVDLLGAQEVYGPPVFEEALALYQQTDSQG